MTTGGPGAAGGDSGNARGRTNGGEGGVPGSTLATLAGDLAAFRAYDLCQLLSLSRATGTLFLRAPGVRGVIVVEDGVIVRVRSRPNPERLGHLLLTRGAVGEAVLAAALAAKTGGDRRPLGEILVAAGAVSSAALGDALIAQARDALATLLILPAGRFAFAPGILFPGEQRLPVHDPQALVLDALARLDERAAGHVEHPHGNVDV